MVNAIQDSFKAVLNVMPLSEHKLTVTGQEEVPTTGWQLSLVDAVPQNTNPSDLILKGVAVEPTGPAGDVVHPVDVRFDKTPASEYFRNHLRSYPLKSNKKMAHRTTE